jgi:hypothetical protein
MNKFRIITGFLCGTAGYDSSCRRCLQMPGSPGTPGSRNNGTGTGHNHPEVWSYVFLPYQPDGSLFLAYSVKNTGILYITCGKFWVFPMGFRLKNQKNGIGDCWIMFQDR